MHHLIIPPALGAGNPVMVERVEFTTGFHLIPAAAVTGGGGWGGGTTAATNKVTITTLNNPYRRRKLSYNYR